MAWSQSQSKGLEMSASTATRIHPAKELSVHGTVYRLLLLKLPLSSCSRRGWMIGVKMWIFKASASRPLHLQVTSYINSNVTVINPGETEHNDLPQIVCLTVM